MAGVNKKVDVVIGAKDETAKGLAKTKASIKKAAGEIQKSSGALVSEATGRRLSQFNEKTEKMRQSLNAVALSMGASGVGGEALYMGGTLSYLVGRLGPVEWALLGIAAAGTALISVFARTTEAEKAWTKQAEYHKSLLEELKTKTEDLVKAEKERMLGLENTRQKQEHEVLAHLEKLKVEERAYTETIAELADDMTSAELRNRIKQRKILRDRVTETKAAYDELRKSGKAFFDWEVRQAELENQMEQARIDAAKGKKDKDDPGSEFKYEGEDPTGPLEKLLTAKEEKHRKYLENIDSWNAEFVNRQKQRMQEEERAHKYWIDRQQAYEDAKLRKKQQNQKQAVENSIQLFSQLGQLMAQNEAQQAAVRIANIIAVAGLKVYEEAAEGWGAIARYDYPAAIAHFTSSALHAVTAGSQIAAAGGSVGGGGGGTLGAAGVSEPSERREPEKREYKFIINLGGREAGRAITEVLEDYQDQTNPGRRRKKLS